MRNRILVQLTLCVAGMAALAWEVIWQLAASLSLGVSAWGTAITLAATMGGMTAGALLSGRWLTSRPPKSPLKVYGAIEASIGLFGLFVLSGFHLLEQLDVWVYSQFPAAALVVHLLGIAMLLGLPAMGMGATIPLFGLIARQCQTSISALYAVNTAGAACGALLIAFTLLPNLGVSLTVQLVASINLSVALFAWILARGLQSTGDTAAPTPTQPVSGDAALSMRMVALVVFATGFVTFSLEVIWFRTLRAVFTATTDSFAVMLAAVLVALAIGARLVPILRRRGVALANVLALAGIMVIAATFLIDRYDLLVALGRGHHLWFIASKFLWAFGVFGPPTVLLGTALPWLLDVHVAPARWGRVYAINTLGAIIGAVSAAWLTLPLLGILGGSLTVGALLVGVALPMATVRVRISAVVVAMVAAAAVFGFRSGVGHERIQRAGEFGTYRVLSFAEGPESTVAAIQYTDGYRALMIDGFQAASVRGTANYMAWMGHLPMLLHHDPKRALVLCFGTGQTANAVRQERPIEVDVVDLNAAVFEMARHFPVNQAVLSDAKVNAVVMDGRAWLRRTQRRYDVITLEPMPPKFSGVNALYSAEFYQIMARRLRPGGIVAQWLPYHLVAPEESAAIAHAFLMTFADALLWHDPASGTGILVGRQAGEGQLGDAWPGMGRLARNLSERQIRAGVVLRGATLRRYGSVSEPVTDDNQLLAYSSATLRDLPWGIVLQRRNHKLIEFVKQQAASTETKAR